MKVAIIHDWVISQGGAEKVLKALLELFSADLFTLVYDEKQLPSFPAKKIVPSFIQHLPFAQTAYRHYLPLFPLAIERFDLKEYDLILSSSHAVAKGVKTHPGQLHICYCHTPMRYAFDLKEQYLKEFSGLKKQIASFLLERIRKWDVKTAKRVDYFIANSHYIQKRIHTHYGRDSIVIHPPVNTEALYTLPKENFFLTLSRFVPYKRIDLIIEAFNQRPDLKLIIIGTGPEEKKLKSKAGSNIHFLGFQEDAMVHNYLARAKAFVFAAEEDFGIVPVEAQAAGTPVIAYGKGGALETVIPGKTGLFFEEQTPTSLLKTLETFEQLSFDPQTIQAHAQTFSTGAFKKKIEQFVIGKWRDFV